jgi:hypothetical protein
MNEVTNTLERLNKNGLISDQTYKQALLYIEKNKTPTILTEKREILQIRTSDCVYWLDKDIKDHYDRFEPYQESDGSIWFNVIDRNNVIIEKINSVLIISITYA